jgi:hypothetical protein
MRKTYYYKDPLNDDFADTNIATQRLPSDYKYISHDPLKGVWDFLLHHFVATPLGFLYQKVIYREQIVNRKVLIPYLLSGCFIYGNHTRAAGDAFTPNIAVFPRKAYIVTSPDAVSIPGVRNLVKSLGGIPLPNDISGIRRFHSALLQRSKWNHIVIYPEAHIWPYYTDIRPFKDTSFRYPAEAGKPVFSFTVTYKKRAVGSFPRTVVYVDGPFFPDKDKTLRENQKMLRDLVYKAMLERSKNSDYNYNNYVYRPDDTVKGE